MATRRGEEVWLSEGKFQKYSALLEKIREIPQKNKDRALLTFFERLKPYERRFVHPEGSKKIIHPTPHSKQFKRMPLP